MSIEVVWPAPFLPSVIAKPHDTIDLILSCKQCSNEALLGWAANLALRDTNTGERFALRPLGVEVLGLTRVPLYARGAASILGRAGACLARLRIAVSGSFLPSGPVRTRVFDLVRMDTVVRMRAVAAHRTDGHRLHLAFASDLHVAALWNDIAAAVERHAGQWRSKLLHPTELLSKMADELTVLAAKGELDLLILGGDLVDHVYAHRAGRTAVEDTNLPLLLRPLSRLPVPIYAIAGNHDYRLYPWRPRVYPFSGAGLPRFEAARILRKAGLWDRWPIRPADLHALRTSEADGRPALRHHLTTFAPATDFTVDFGDLRLIFLGTGRDILPRWRTVERGRLGMLARALPISYHHPDCEGLSEDQLAFLDASLASCSRAALFFHAPLLNASRSLARLPRLAPDGADDLAARIRFERQLFRSGARHGIFFRNPALFVRALRSFRKPLAAFSGHVHTAAAIKFDPVTGVAERVPLTQADAARGHILVTAPAVGQTCSQGDGFPGYLLAHFESGRLASLEQRTLRPPLATT